MLMWCFIWMEEFFENFVDVEVCCVVIEEVLYIQQELVWLCDVLDNCYVVMFRDLVVFEDVVFELVEKFDCGIVECLNQFGYSVCEVIGCEDWVKVCQIIDQLYVMFYNVFYEQLEFILGMFVDFVGECYVVFDKFLYDSIVEWGMVCVEDGDIDGVWVVVCDMFNNCMFN